MHDMYSRVTVCLALWAGCAIVREQVFGLFVETGSHRMRKKLCREMRCRPKDIMLYI